mgnify:CR=1 FL=1
MPMPPSLSRFIERLRVWYLGSMANRVMLLAMSLVLAVYSISSMIAFFAMEEELTETAAIHLTHKAESLRDRLQDRLVAAIANAENLARQSLVSNALIDSLGRGAYLRPYLREQRDQHAEIAEISLFDWEGRTLASSQDDPRLRQALVAEVMKNESPVKWLENHDDQTRLLVAAPVRLPQTGTVEGVLVSEIRLQQMAGQLVGAGHDDTWLTLMHGDRVVFRDQRFVATEPVLTESVPLDATPGLAALGLRITAALPISEAEAPLRSLQLIFLVLALTVAVATYLGARALSRKVVGPLARLSTHAQGVASEGVAGLREIEVRGSDEVAWMGMAFNSMVRSLREVYEQLELRVHERTQALETRELYLRAILDNFPFMIWLKDDQCRFLAVNKVMSDACRQPSPEVMVGLSDLDVWPRDLALSYQADDQMVMERRAEKVVEEPIESEVGVRRWYETYKKPVVNAAGRVLGTVGFCRDITERREAEAAMRLRDRAMMSTSDGISIVDMCHPDRPIIYANPAFERITGYRFEEVRGRNIRFLHTGDWDQPALLEVQEAIREGRECRVVLRNYRKDGHLFWNQLTIAPVLDEAGRVTHYIGIQHDISDTVEATHALAESEKRLSLTIDALRDGLWDWNIPDGTVYQSPSWAHMLGYEPGELTGNIDSFTRCLSEDDSRRVWDMLQAHQRGETPVYACEHRMIRKDGQEIWVSDRGKIVEWAADGTPLRMVGTITDITERYQAEQQLISWMQRLDSILTLSPDAYIYFGSDSSVASVNPAFEHMTGLLSGEVVGLSYTRLIEKLQDLADPTEAFPPFLEIPVLAPASPSVVRPAESGKAPAHLHLMRPQRRVLAYNFRFNENDHSAVLFLGDVTRETEVDRMKSEFLSTAAHELRTPMASIMGFSELLLRRSYDADTVRDFLETIHRQSKRLTDLLNELLDLARIEARAGKDFKFSVQPLHTVLQETVRTVVAGGDRTVRLDIEGHLPLVRIDSAKIQQALLNVLSNAFKYSPEGGDVDVSLRREVAFNGQTRLKISIRDHGIGMTPEQTERVFERFFRADPSGNIPGTGLGMALVKEIVELHGGSVDIDSTFGEGTTVSLYLPVITQEAQVLAA